MTGAAREAGRAAGCAAGCAAERAAAVLAPEAPLFTDNDPVLFGRALAAAVVAVAWYPWSGVSLAMRWGRSW
jgi:hypothetical protein